MRGFFYGVLVGLGLMSNIIVRMSDAWSERMHAVLSQLIGLLKCFSIGCMSNKNQVY